MIEITFQEGEGLLPVRWMPPESLVDGVFTSQSDVWAFGVLMWEITTLGQQPYPAMTNFEVLHHVSAGNRLPRPLNCPPALHQLMLRCWSVADARPSFKVCLDNIVALRSNTEDAVLSPIHAGHVARRGTDKRLSFHLRAAHRMEPLRKVFAIFHLGSRTNNLVTTSASCVILFRDIVAIK